MTKRKWRCYSCAVINEPDAPVCWYCGGTGGATVVVEDEKEAGDD